MMCSNLAGGNYYAQHPPVLGAARFYPPDPRRGRGRLQAFACLPGVLVSSPHCVLAPLVSLGEVCLVQEAERAQGAAFVSFWRMCTGIRTRNPWAQCGVFHRSPQLLCSVRRVVSFASAVGRVRVEQLCRLPLDVVD